MARSSSVVSAARPGDIEVALQCWMWPNRPPHSLSRRSAPRGASDIAVARPGGPRTTRPACSPAGAGLVASVSGGLVQARWLVALASCASHSARPRQALESSPLSLASTCGSACEMLASHDEPIKRSAQIQSEGRWRLWEFEVREAMSRRTLSAVQVEGGARADGTPAVGQLQSSMSQAAA